MKPLISELTLGLIGASLKMRSIASVGPEFDLRRIAHEDMPPRTFIVGPVRAGKTRERDLSGAYAPEILEKQTLSDYAEMSAYSPEHYELDRRPRHPHRVTKGAFGKKR